MRLPLILALLPLPALAQGVDFGAKEADFAPAFENQTRAPALPGPAVGTEVMASGLAHPWGIAELPSGDFLVTERPGTLRLVLADGTVGRPLSGTPEVDARNQGGMLDVMVPADFAESRRVYLTYAKRTGGGTVTAAGFGTLSRDGTAIEGFRDIFVQDPPSPTPMHYGSRIVEADGHVWITTGEHSTRPERLLAQDLSTTYGKIIRLTPDGDVPADNPFVDGDGDPQIWSYGHRNVQGAAVDADGTVWTIEHGPRGGDELNRPEAGLDYGWPAISYGINYGGSDVGTGQAVAEGMEQPVYYWDPVIAPGGAEFYRGDVWPEYQGDLLIGGLVAAAIVRLDIEGDRVAGEARLAPGVGRVRDVEVTSGGEILMLIDAPAPFGEIRRLVRQ